MDDLTRTSKFISLILRHKPEVAGVTLDEHGWARVDDLIAGVSRTHPLDRATLEEIVRTDPKGRYSFSDDGTLIRANQGHSVNVDVELERRNPPETLWHGTAERFATSIGEKGLLPMSRLYVHLSGTPELARTVGSRHGRPLVYRVAAGEMSRDGHEFFLSANGVWLTKEVPAHYLHALEKSD